MVIQESAENYLERILMINNEKGVVRSIDIAEALQVSKPSVSIAMKKLSEHGYIIMDKDNHISLTDKGQEVAEAMYERHKLFTDWLISLGVDEKVAHEDACKIEHVLSDESFEAFKQKAKEDL